MIKLTRTEFNKLVAYVDKNLTWNDKEVNDDNVNFYTDDGLVDVSKNGWLYIGKNHKCVFGEHVKDFKDIRHFKAMISLIG